MNSKKSATSPRTSFLILENETSTTRHSLPHSFGRMTDVYVCTFEICKLVVLSMLVLDIKVNRQKTYKFYKEKESLDFKIQLYMCIYSEFMNSL